MLWKNIWNRKKTVLKIELMYKGKSQGSYIESMDNPIVLPIGDEDYRLSILKMSEKEIEQLPEFTGF